MARTDAIASEGIDEAIKDVKNILKKEQMVFFLKLSLQ
jgi:hypothetical protein